MLLPIAPAGAGGLALLGAGTNGTLTMTYTDGDTGTAGIGFSGGTLGGRPLGGEADQPTFADRDALPMPCRNTQRIVIHVFATAPIPLAGGSAAAPSPRRRRAARWTSSGSHSADIVGVPAIRTAGTPTTTGDRLQRTVAAVVQATGEDDHGTRCSGDSRHGAHWNHDVRQCG